MPIPSVPESRIGPSQHPYQNCQGAVVGVFLSGEREQGYFSDAEPVLVVIEIGKVF